MTYPNYNVGTTVGISTQPTPGQPWQTAPWQPNTQCQPGQTYIGTQPGQVYNGSIQYTLPGMYIQPQFNQPYDINSTNYINNYYHDQSWLSNFMERNSILALIKEKNYTFLSQIADHVLKLDAKLFDKIEKMIVGTKDFIAISTFCSGIKNRGITHLTKPLIQSYLVSKVNNKEILLSAFLTQNHGRLDLKYLINFGYKNNLFEVVEWINSACFMNKDSQNRLMNFLDTNKIDIKKIDKLFIKNPSSSKIFHYAKDFDRSDRRALFQVLKRRGEEDLINRFLNEVKCDWVDALRNMR